LANEKQRGHDSFITNEAAGRENGDSKFLAVTLNWRQFGAMPVTLSIKNAPDDVVERLRARARRHHRSLQGELLAIVEDAVRPDWFLTPAEVLAEVRRLGISSPSESAAMIRADRDRDETKYGS